MDSFGQWTFQTDEGECARYQAAAVGGMRCAAPCAVGFLQLKRTSANLGNHKAAPCCQVAPI